MQLVGLDVIDFLLHLVKKHNTFRLPFDPPPSSSPQIFWKIKEFKATQCFTHYRTANTIQLLVAVKTNFLVYSFSGQVVGKGTNIATCLK